MKKALAVVFIMMLVLTGCSMGAIYSNEKKIASDNNSYNLDVKEQKIDGNKFTGNIAFEGMDTIWKYQAEEDSLIDITYLIKLTAGKAKLVLISPDGDVVNIVETTDKSDLMEASTISLSLKKGENRIKLVAADNAKISFEIGIEVGDFLELGM